MTSGSDKTTKQGNLAKTGLLRRTHDYCGKQTVAEYGAVPCTKQLISLLSKCNIFLPLRFFLLLVRSKKYINVSRKLRPLPTM